MRRDTLTLQARYVFPVEGRRSQDGCLTIEQGRIGWVGPAERAARRPRPGQRGDRPGFRQRAHPPRARATRTTGTTGRRSGTNEVCLAAAGSSSSGGPEPSNRCARPSAATSRPSIEAGTTLLADTTTAGLSWEPIAEAPLRAVVFAELIGLKRDRGLETSDAGLELAGVDPPRDPGRRLRPAGPEPARTLQHLGLALPQGGGQPAAALHPPGRDARGAATARSTATGRCGGSSKTSGAWDDEWEPIGPRPADYVRRGELRNADWLIAHGTYFDPDDFWQLRPEAAPDGHRVAIAFCPRTHARFGHAPHPYRALLERGVIVCLGTDSLASSASLSILDEMRFLHRRDDSLSGALLLTMATLFGAWALRAETTTGSLKPGKSADLAIVALPDRDAPDPFRPPARIRPARGQHRVRGRLRHRPLDRRMKTASSHLHREAGGPPGEAPAGGAAMVEIAGDTLVPRASISSQGVPSTSWRSQR